MSIEDEIIGNIKHDKDSNFLILILFIMSSVIWGSHKIHSESIHSLKEVDIRIQESVTELRDKMNYINGELHPLKLREDRE